MPSVDQISQLEDINPLHVMVKRIDIAKVHRDLAKKHFSYEGVVFIEVSAHDEPSADPNFRPLQLEFPFRLRSLDEAVQVAYQRAELLARSFAEGAHEAIQALESSQTGDPPSRIE